MELGAPAVPEQLLAALRNKLANYKLPKGLTVLESIPRIGVSKVDRVALAQRLEDDSRGSV